MLRPFLYVARPTNLAGAVSSAGTALIAFLALVPVVLARLPEAWVALAGGYGVAVRAVIALLVLWAVGWMRAVLYSRLPGAAYLLGGTLHLHEGGRHHRIDVDEIEDVVVELRPAPQREVLVATMRSGSAHDICPVEWPGAGRLYRSLDKKVRRAAVKRTRG